MKKTYINQLKTVDKTIHTFKTNLTKISDSDILIDIHSNVRTYRDSIVFFSSLDNAKRVMIEMTELNVYIEKILTLNNKSG